LLYNTPIKQYMLKASVSR